MAQVCVVLALPIGINSGADNETDLVYGLYGGAGQYASIIEGCESPTRSAENSFVEGGGGMYMRIPQGKHSPWVLGLTGGVWYSDVTLASWTYYGSDSTYHNQVLGKRTFGYIAPSINVEGEFIGIGGGVLIGRYPGYFDDDIEYLPHFTGHLRLGPAKRFHLSVTANESLPMNAGGGSYNAGLAFPVGRRLQMYHGFSFGGYHGLGLTHQFRIRLNQSSALDVNLRWAPIREDTGTFEGGIGVGLRKYFGKVRQSSPGIE